MLLKMSLLMINAGFAHSNSFYRKKTVYYTNNQSYIWLCGQFHNPFLSQWSGGGKLIILVKAWRNSWKWQDFYQIKYANVFNNCCALKCKDNMKFINMTIPSTFFPLVIHRTEKENWSFFRVLHDKFLTTEVLSPSETKALKLIV